MKTKKVFAAVLVLLVFAGSVRGAQDTAFTYQGLLNDGPGLANGSYDFEFRAFSVPTGGSFFAGPLTNSAVVVSNGLFTTTIDYGTDLFDGPGPVFLEIAVRVAGSNSFNTLSPRQAISSAPHALAASLAYEAVTALNLKDNVGVRSLNSLQNEVTLVAGQNVTIAHGPGNNLVIASPSGGNGPWQVNGTNTFYNSGNVGISVSSPAARLHVHGASEGIRLDGQASGNANLAFMSFRDLFGERIGYVGDGSGGDNNIFLTADSGDVVLNTAAGRSLTVKATGQVGIGTTTPQSALEVHGDVRLGATGQLRAVSSEENLRIVRGVIGSTGGILVGTGFSVAHPSKGVYDVTFTTAFAGPPAITATADTANTAVAYVMTVGVTASVAHLVLSDGGLSDLPIHFIAIGPR